MLLKAKKLPSSWATLLFHPLNLILLREGPVKPLLDALCQLGMHFQFLKQENQFPLRVSSLLLGGKSEVNGLSSQYLSALLLSLPCAPEKSEIKVIDLHERPYIEMTLNRLTKQNIIYQHERTRDTDFFYIPGKQKYHPFQISLSGDSSSVSYLIAAAVLIPSEIKIHGLKRDDPQGDKKLFLY